MYKHIARKYTSRFVTQSRIVKTFLENIIILYIVITATMSIIYHYRI